MLLHAELRERKRVYVILDLPLGAPGRDQPRRLDRVEQRQGLRFRGDQRRAPSGFGCNCLSHLVPRGEQNATEQRCEQPLPADGRPANLSWASIDRRDVSEIIPQAPC
jgi:hypothetical protein